MPVLSCSSISKTYILDTILEEISFSIEEGDKIGVIGLNGSGKTTLFNILSGELDRDEGEIYLQRNLNIGYLKQHTKIDSENTVFDDCLQVFTNLIAMEEDIRGLEAKIAEIGAQGESPQLIELMDQYGHLSERFIELNGYGYRSEIKGILIGLGFEEKDFSKNVYQLSGGQKSRLALAKLLLKKPDLLLLDEPTNHLDIGAIDWLEKFLRDYRGSFLVISHDRYFLDKVADKIFHLENKGLRIYNMNYSKFMVQRKKDLELLQKQYEDQQKEVKRQEEIISRFMNYGDSRYIKQAQSRQKLLDKMKLIDRPSEERKTRIRFEPKVKSGRDVLEVKDLSKSYGPKKLFDDVGFNIYRGERVGLIGANGVGKTTLFKIILGLIDMDKGHVSLGHHVHSAYFQQEMDNLNLDKTVIDEIWDENPKLTIYDLRTILSQFLFIGDDILKEISDLSGGEKGRLSLLKLMLSKANFLLMDEPTNHLDIDSKEVLEDAILNYEGTLFVISHDRYFLNRVTDKILELTEEGIKEYLGNYDYYLEKKNELIYEEERSEKTKTQIRLERKKEKELLDLARDSKRKISQLEEEIAEKEDELVTLDRLFSNPDNYDDLDEIVKLGHKREVIQADLNILYEKWIRLSQ